MNAPNPVPDSSPDRSQRLFRKADQAAAAGVLAISLAVMGGQWIYSQLHQGEALEFVAGTNRRTVVAKPVAAPEDAATEEEASSAPEQFVDLAAPALAPAPPSLEQMRVDVNTAPWQELTLLPGIGETLARRMVDSREVDGPFGAVDDLDRVRGIGPKTLQKIRPFIKPIPPPQT